MGNECSDISLKWFPRAQTPRWPPIKVIHDSNSNNIYFFTLPYTYQEI